MLLSVKRDEGDATAVVRPATKATNIALFIIFLFNDIKFDEYWLVSLLISAEAFYLYSFGRGPRPPMPVHPSLQNKSVDLCSLGIKVVWFLENEEYPCMIRRAEITRQPKTYHWTWSRNLSLKLYTVDSNCLVASCSYRQGSVMSPRKDLLTNCMIY